MFTVELGLNYGISFVFIVELIELWYQYKIKVHEETKKKLAIIEENEREPKVMRIMVSFMTCCWYIQSTHNIHHIIKNN